MEFECVNGQLIYLLPYWMKPFLVDEFYGSCRDGKPRTIKTAEIKNHRLGLMAVGVVYKL